MSEFREDPSSGDWVIIAPGRAARPSFLDVKKPARKPTPLSECPFEPSRLKETGNWPPRLIYKNIVVIPNKYPVLTEHGKGCAVSFMEGPSHAKTGVGMHELAITKDHNKNFADIDKNTAKALFHVFQDRCRVAAKDPCLTYVVPFFNWGPAAGASVWHPHYQILGLPIVPGHSARSHARAAAYFKRHRQCIRCGIIKTEKAAKKRIIAENKHAIAIAPYASKFPFEIRILPKKHFSHFYKTPTAVVNDVALLTQKVMLMLRKNVNDPDLNYFLHEAPVDGKSHAYHHWHVEILPRLSMAAGFEFSTGIFINVVDPANATAILRGKSQARGLYH